MTTNANPDIINDAKQYAREAIRETWPTAREVAKPAASMYEFDAICIDDEACPINSISIMHDPDVDTFALIENARPAIPPKEETPQVPAFHFDGPIDWDKLSEDHVIAYFRGDLATSSPESYTIKEMKAISDGMFANTAAVEVAMQKNFQSWTPQAQAKMLDLLQSENPDNFAYWIELLIGDMPDNLDGMRYN